MRRLLSALATNLVGLVVVVVCTVAVAYVLLHVLPPLFEWLYPYEQPDSPTVGINT